MKCKFHPEERRIRSVLNFRGFYAYDERKHLNPGFKYTTEMRTNNEGDLSCSEFCIDTEHEVQSNLSAPQACSWETFSLPGMRAWYGGRGLDGGMQHAENNRLTQPRSNAVTKLPCFKRRRARCHEIATKAFKNTLYIDIPLSASPK